MLLHQNYLIFKDIFRYDYKFSYDTKKIIIYELETKKIMYHKLKLEIGIKIMQKHFDLIGILLKEILNLQQLRDWRIL